MATPKPTVEQLRELYAKHDKDEDGHLTRDELIPILTELLGYDATPYATEVMLIADTDGSGTINSLQELDLALKKTGTIELTTIFKKYDKDGKFGLSEEELTPLLEEILGFPPGVLVDEVMLAADHNGSGTIDTMCELQTALAETKAIKVWILKNMFHYYDSKGTGHGFITQDDILKITESLPADQKEELKSLFRKADLNGDGKVSMEEYVQHMMKK